MKVLCYIAMFTVLLLVMGSPMVVPFVAITSPAWFGAMLFALTAFIAKRIESKFSTVKG